VIPPKPDKIWAQRRVDISPRYHFPGANKTTINTLAIVQGAREDATAQLATRVQRVR